MLFRRFYNEPLAQAGYLLADGDEGLIVDPLRDPDDVLAFAESRGIRIRHVVATHVHADFVAGLGEVAARTGARIALGERFRGTLPCERLEDDGELQLGGLTIRILPTPGHTPESICLSVLPHDGASPLLLTGDTLFVGDVGRPDLATDPDTPAEVMARTLFESLRDRIAPLPDDTVIWPAHGAGSACGSAIAAAASSTLGRERLTNWALDEPDPERFCARLLGNLRPPPRYFARCAAMNQAGPPLLASLPAPSTLTLAEVERALAAGALVLDVRLWTEHGRDHWPGALNVGLHGGEFEAWAGALLPEDRGVLLHCANEREAHEAILRLRRIGLDRVLGITFAHPPADAAGKLPQIDALDLFEPGRPSSWQIVDVRRQQEYETAHIPGAVHCELDAAMAIADGRLDPKRRTALYCEGGYRSSAAAPQLRAAGFRELHNVQDGMRGWRENHLPVQSQ